MAYYIKDMDMINKYIGLSLNNANIHFWPSTAFLRYRNSTNNPVQVIEVNNSAAKMLSYCNGQYTISEVAVMLSQHYNAEYSDVLSKVVSFALHTESLGYIRITNNPNTVEVSVTGNNDFETPMHTAIEITYECNLYCRHCYNSSGPNNNTTMPIHRVNQLFDFLRKRGVSTIELTGGEPLTHPDITKILSDAVNIFDMVGIITNGTLVNDQYLNILTDGKATTIMQIDLDGATAEYVDWFRGKSGVYEKEINAISKTAKRNIMLRVAMLVTPYNIMQIENTVILAKSLGANAFITSLVVPQGRAKDASMMLDVNTLAIYLDIYNLMKDRYPDFIYQETENPLPILLPGNCGAGSRTVTITPTGDVKLCQMSNVATYCFGNIFNDSYDTIFKHKSNAMHEIVPPNSDTCGDCQHLWYCAGCIHRAVDRASEISVRKCSWIQPYTALFIREDMNV